MRDFTSTEYEKRDYVLKYKVDKKKKDLIIYYADGESIRVAYSINGEIRLLNKMKGQALLYGADFLKGERRKYRFKKVGYLAFASMLTVILTIGTKGAIELGAVGTNLIVPLSINVLAIAATKRRYNEVDDKIRELNEDIREYAKNIFYIKNEKVFANERLLRDDVAPKLPEKVQDVIEEKSAETFDVPYINLNNIDKFSMQDLQKTYNTSLQSRGKMLTLRPYKRNKN